MYLTQEELHAALVERHGADIQDQLDHAAVGIAGLGGLGSNIAVHLARLGYWLAVPWWGKGIMTEAVRAICREAFRAFDIVRIYAEPFARNTGSCRVLEKAGFTLEGTLRRSVYKGGEILDSRVYALLREELELPDIHTHGGERL